MQNYSLLNLLEALLLGIFLVISIRLIVKIVRKANFQKWIKQQLYTVNLRIEKFITDKLKSISNKLKDETQGLDESNFEDLTPTINLTEDKTYSKTIKWALENKNIKNIALTGPHGSGKSSILKTFQIENKEYKYLNISLATFNQNNIEENNGQVKNKFIENQIIELSILQQIFYHEKQSNLPFSRFKRIRNLTTQKLLSYTTFWFLFIISFCRLYKYEYLEKLDFVKLPDFFYLNETFIDYLALVVFLLGVFYISSSLIGIILNLKMTKLNLKDAEIDLSKEDSSILNKHIDEILYFFEATKFNVVIIEDLDRFNKPEIFTKLRELNLLINNAKQIKRHISFIYAVMDDMFQDENRTKFFDFIIPVIPVITASNSGEKLLEKLVAINKGTLNENKLSEDFINDISLFIEDMRMLKNICNEFLIYRDKLNTIDIKYNNLMAIIVYKNFYPGDFAKLHIAEGVIYKAFNNKKNLTLSETDRLDVEIKKIENELIESETILIENVEELRSVYIQAFLNRFPQALAFKFGETEYSFQQAKDDDAFNLFENTTNIIYKYYDPSYGSHSNPRDAQSKISFKTLEVDVNSKMTYNQREKLALLKNENTIQEKRKKIEELKEQKRAITYWPLKRLIEEKIPLNTEYQKLQDERLLWYLLSEGLIEENYYDYMSFFYEGRFTKEDKRFILGNRYREILDEKIVLTNFENIIDSLRPEEYLRPSVLNHSLLDFLASNKLKFEEEYELIILQLSNENEKSVEYIDKYISSTSNYLNIFVGQLVSKWNNLWKFISHNSNYTESKQEFYLILIIKHATVNDIIQLNIDNIFVNYISSKKDFMYLINERSYINKIKEIIEQLNIKFSSLELQKDSNELFDFVYEHSHYVINEQMIELFINLKGGLKTKNIPNIKSSNYNTILNSDCPPLINYINSNINDYVSNVFIHLNGNILDLEEPMIKLLNNKSLNIDSKKAVIEKMIPQLNDISLIENSDIYEHILLSAKAVINWKNYFTYWRTKGELDDTIISLLNINCGELSKTMVNEKIETEEQNGFIKIFAEQIILNDNIKTNSLEYLLKSIPFKYPSLNIKNLPEKKIDLLLGYNVLALTSDYINQISEHFGDNKSIILIENYIDEYLNSPSEYILNGNDLNYLLASVKINSEQKVKIIETNYQHIQENISLLDTVCNILSGYKFIPLDYDFLKNIIINSSNLESRIKLINIQFESLTEDNITELLKNLGEPYENITINGKSPILDNTSYHQILINKLLYKGYISSANTKEEKIRIYTKKG